MSMPAYQDNVHKTVYQKTVLRMFMIGMLYQITIQARHLTALENDQS